MKKSRQIKILELISQYEIETQEALVQRLRESGFAVTQATVSRDIKDMRLVKEMSGVSPFYKYVQSAEREERGVDYDSVLAQSMIKADFSGNLLVVKCNSGMASAAGAVIDASEFEGIVGSVAGDDTILVVMRTAEDAKNFAGELMRIKAAKR